MKKYFLLFFIVFQCLYTFSQENLKRDFLNIKLTYGMVNGQPADAFLVGIGDPVYSYENQIIRSNYGLNLNFFLNSKNNFGLYFNYSELFRMGVSQLDNLRWTYIFNPTKTLYYGLNYIYLIPINNHNSIFKLTPYVLASAGLVSEKYYTTTISNSNDSAGYLSEEWDKPVFEAGIGVGANCYLTRSLGIFTEILGGNFFNMQYFKWKAGITFKF